MNQFLFFFHPAAAHHADNSTYCPSSSEIVTGCQAAVNYALRLVCRQCPAGITWQQWSGEWRNIPGNNQTLQYPAKQVDPSLAGCYRCSCNHSEGGVYTVTISVDVKPPGEMPCLDTEFRDAVLRHSRDSDL